MRALNIFQTLASTAKGGSYLTLYVNNGKVDEWFSDEIDWYLGDDIEFDEAELFKEHKRFYKIQSYPNTPVGFNYSFSHELLASLTSFPNQAQPGKDIVLFSVEECDAFDAFFTRLEKEFNGEITISINDFTASYWSLNDAIFKLQDSGTIGSNLAMQMKASGLIVSIDTNMRDGLSHRDEGNQNLNLYGSTIMDVVVRMRDALFPPTT